MLYKCCIILCIPLCRDVLFACMCWLKFWREWIKMSRGLVSDGHKRRHLARAFAAFLAWTSLLMRIISRLTGLGTKPTMPSSFTGRPIHQSLLNFWCGKGKTEFSSAAFRQPCRRAECVSNLFDVEEVSRFKRYGMAGDGDVVIVRWGVREVTTHCECHRFVL